MEAIYLAIALFEFLMMLIVVALTLRIRRHYRQAYDEPNRRSANRSAGPPGATSIRQVDPADRNKVLAQNRRAFEQFGGSQEGT